MKPGDFSNHGSGAYWKVAQRVETFGHKKLFKFWSLHEVMDMN